MSMDTKEELSVFLSEEKTEKLLLKGPGHMTLLGVVRDFVKYLLAKGNDVTQAGWGSDLFAPPNKPWALCTLVSLVSHTVYDGVLLYALYAGQGGTSRSTISRARGIA